MGDIADMMLDGTLCEGCGGYIPEKGSGYPRRCRDCKKDIGHQHGTYTPSNIQCDRCKRWVTKIGLKDHLRDAHGVK